MPLDHLTITASDFAASLSFYDATMPALGLSRVVELVDEEEDEPELEGVGWGVGERPVLWLVAGSVPTSGLHVALRGNSRAAVEAFYAAALGAGGRSHDAPRRWAIFRRGQFNAIVVDPGGNLVEAFAPE